MDIEEAKAVLSTELAKLRSKTYNELVALIGQPQTLELTASSGRWYQLEFEVTWDDPCKPNDVLRVFGSIDDGGIRAYLPVSDGFLITPHGTFIGE